MTHPELLEILCCPETHQPVREAPAALVKELNRAIRQGEAKDGRRAGERTELSGALLRRDGRFAYPVRHGIPIMLIEERLEVPASFRPEADPRPSVAAGSPGKAGSKEEIAGEGDPEHHEVQPGSGP